MAGQKCVRRQQPPLYQRCNQGDKARGVAAGVGDPLGCLDGIPLLLAQLREAVNPAWGGPVGGGGVDDPGIGVFHQLYRLHGSLVRQAEEHQVGLVHQLFPLGGVLALVFVDEQESDVLPARQPVVDLEAGGALLAVDVDFWFTHKHYTLSME